MVAAGWTFFVTIIVQEENGFTMDLMTVTSVSAGTKKWVGVTIMERHYILAALTVIIEMTCFVTTQMAIILCGSRTPILLDNLLVPDGKEPRITANVRNASSV